MGKIFFILLRFIRSSKLLTRYIWGIKIDSNLHETFWDLTTLVLRKEILTIKKKKYILIWVVDNLQFSVNFLK